MWPNVEMRALVYLQGVAVFKRRFASIMVTYVCFHLTMDPLVDTETGITFEAAAASRKVTNEWSGV